MNQSTSAPFVLEGACWDVANPKNTGNVIISGSKDWPYVIGVPTKTVSFNVSDAFLRREWVHVNDQTYYQINPSNYTNKNGVVGGATEGDPGNPNNVNGGRLTPDEGVFWWKMRR